MAAYHIWHPSLVGEQPPALDCFLTLGDAFFLARGTDALVHAALEVIGVRRRPRGWRFTAMRTHYFSSYRQQSSRWQDRWDLAWRLTVDLEGDEIPRLVDIPGWGYLDLEATDASFDPDDRPDRWPAWPCLVLADLADPIAAVAARRVVATRCPDAGVTTGLAFGRTPQLRCDLGARSRSYYEDSAVVAEQLVAELAAAGAAVHYLESRERPR